MAFTLAITICLVASLNAAEFDYGFARKLFPLAAGAYAQTSPKGCIFNHFKGYDGDKRQLFFVESRAQCDGFESDCYGYLATLTRQKAIVLGFRGTNSGLQLKAEFLTSNGVVPMGSGEVAWYFYNAFSKVWGNDAKGVKGLERAFKDQIKKHPKYNIWITGHSLGGAMASLAAYHIANTYNKISEGINKRIRLVTFGEPRSGNAAYAEDFNKKIDYAFRLVNNRDPVPHIPFSLRLPFSSKPGYFTHHKYEVWFPNGMGTLSNWNTCLGEAESNTKCSNHLWIKGNPFDHIWYFDKKVSAYGNNTCVD